MKRRSVVGRLVASITELSVVHRLPEGIAEQVPTTTWHRFNPADIAGWVPESAGHRACSKCPARVDDHLATPGLLCPECAAKTDPLPPVAPRSDPFWLLTTEEIARAEGELYRLHTEAKHLEATLDYNVEWTDEEEARDDEIDQLNREAFLLHLLRNASRQYRST